MRTRDPMPLLNCRSTRFYAALCWRKRRLASHWGDALDCGRHCRTRLASEAIGSSVRRTRWNRAGWKRLSPNDSAMAADLRVAAAGLGRRSGLRVRRFVAAGGDVVSLHSGRSGTRGSASASVLCRQARHQSLRACRGDRCVAHAGGLSDWPEADVAGRPAHWTSAVSPAGHRFHRGVGGNLRWMDDLPRQSSSRTTTIESRHAHTDRYLDASVRGFAQFRPLPGGEQMLTLVIAYARNAGRMKNPRSDCRGPAVTGKRPDAKTGNSARARCGLPR